VGPWLASLLFGGEFPAEAIIPRLFVLHVLFLPALVIGAITIHIVLLVLHKHTQYRSPIAREENVVGRYFWPGQVFLSTGLFFLTAAVLAVIGGLFQVNPIWLYGPFDASVVASPAQPDWYVGWLDGALRIFPPFEPVILGITIPSVFVPGIVLPGLLFTIVALWPFIEAWISKDRADHHLLDDPWDHPVRFATGLAILTVFGVLTLAGGNDVLAFYFGTDVHTLTILFRWLSLILPVAVWLVAWRFALARSSGGPSTGAGAPEDAMRPGTMVRRNAAGGFEEVEP
jgi:ubiquinol-cytochrome c reductase cytochrome b subunit